MNSQNSSTSACRYCQSFQTEGRRGGNCEQLGVIVKGSWKACCLAIPKFTTPWQDLEEMLTLPDVAHILPASQPLVAEESVEHSTAYALS